MKDVIGFIVPNEDAKIKVQKLLKKQINDNTLIVKILEQSDILKQAEQLVSQGVNCIIARGGTYQQIENKLNIFVTRLRINNTDILHALNKAKKISNEVYLVLEKSIYFEYNQWKDLLNIDIKIVRFKNIDEIKGVITSIKLADKNAVIIGGIMTTKEAEKCGLASVLIENKEENIIDTYNQAVDLVRRDKENKKKLKLLSSIINNINDAVIVLNNNLVIEHFNTRAKKLLNINEKPLSEKSIKQIPVLKNVLDEINNKEKYNCVKKIGNIKLNFNIVPLIVDNEQVGTVCTIQDIGELQRLERKIRFELNRKGLVSKYTFDDIITTEKSIINLIEKSKKISLSDSTALIYGESGTGKEIFAQSIHNWSKRKKAPFVAVNCAALSDSILESELFGYEEGAFTGARKGGKQGLFELAHGGTIFLDEINSISPKLQSKLLRALEEKEVMRLGSDYIIPLNVRVIAAANEELVQKVKRNEFRSDLFFRLSVLEIKLIPLRERKGDIIPLFEYFVKGMSKEEYFILEDLKIKLINHEWNGNIRELKNIAERFVVYGKSISDFDELFSYKVNEESRILENKTINLKILNNKIEKSIIESLQKSGFSKTQIAEILGISRTAIWKKMNK